MNRCEYCNQLIEKGAFCQACHKVNHLVYRTIQSIAAARHFEPTEEDQKAAAAFIRRRDRTPLTGGTRTARCISCSSNFEAAALCERCRSLPQMISLAVTAAATGNPIKPTVEQIADARILTHKEQ